MNAHPEDGYRFRARTKDELVASDQLAASHGNIRAGKKALDPAASDLGAPSWEDDGQPASPVIVPTQGVPTLPVTRNRQDWIL
jgi:hypothetical protein